MNLSITTNVTTTIGIIYPLIHAINAKSVQFNICSVFYIAIPNRDLIKKLRCINSLEFAKTAIKQLVLMTNFIIICINTILNIQTTEITINETITSRVRHDPKVFCVANFNTIFLI